MERGPALWLSQIVPGVGGVFEPDAREALPAAAPNSSLIGTGVQFAIMFRAAATNALWSLETPTSFEYAIGGVPLAFHPVEAKIRVTSDLPRRAAV